MPSFHSDSDRRKKRKGAMEGKGADRFPTPPHYACACVYCATCTIIVTAFTLPGTYLLPVIAFSLLHWDTLPCCRLWLASQHTTHTAQALCLCRRVVHTPSTSCPITADGKGLGGRKKDIYLPFYHCHHATCKVGRMGSGLGFWRHLPQ